jgi:hypothetical protein
VLSLRATDVRHRVRDALGVYGYSHADGGGALFASKLALTCDPLVRLSRVLDSILKLTVAVRKLLDYDVAAAGCRAVYDVRCQRDSLTFTKFIVCH